MIEHEFFTYTGAQWNEIRTIVRNALGRDADQIERQITPRVGQYSITGMQPLRDRIEIAANQYRLYSAVKGLSPRGAKLGGLRKDVANLRASIISAVAVPFGTKYDFAPHPMLLDCVDADILTATSDYFRKLIRNLDRMKEQAGSRRHNARKTARDQCWNELLAIWCELGGKRSGTAAANFLKVASKPVMRSAVPDIPSIIRWLKRRQNKTAKPVTKPAAR